MNIISICSSPRKHGNTETIIRSVRQGLKKSPFPQVKNRYVFLHDLRILPCKACNKCMKRGKCVIDDDFNQVAVRLVNSDLVNLGSPVYFSDVNAQAKAFIDRTYALWHKKALKGKNVILVASCAESGAGHSIDTMRQWAREHEMNVVASIGAYTEEKGKVLKDEKVVQAIQEAVSDCERVMLSEGKK